MVCATRPARGCGAAPASCRAPGSRAPGQPTAGSSRLPLAAAWRRHYLVGDRVARLDGDDCGLRRADMRWQGGGEIDLQARVAQVVVRLDLPCLTARVDGCELG